MNVLLTGAAGFIGTRLARRLVSSGVQTFNAGRRRCDVLGVENILVSDLGNLREAVGTMRFDGLVHLAAAGVHPGDRDRETIYRVNAAAAPAVVSLGASVGAKAVVIAGSSAEYRASSDRTPISEDAPLETQKVYGASKAAGGILALAEGAALSVPVAVVRLFNVFGPGEAPHRLLPSLFRALAEQRRVKLSPGTQVRDFVYVDDACAGLWTVLEALAQGRLTSGAYNLATGRGTTVKDFANSVARAMNADPEMLEFGAIPLRPDDLPYVVGDASKLRDASGWSPDTSPESGIAKALAELHAQRKDCR